MNQNTAVRIALACWCTLVAGCAARSVPTTQQVSIPIAVSCVKAEDVPAKPVYEFDRLPADASDGAKVMALATDWPRGRSYEVQLEAIIVGCR